MCKRFVLQTIVAGLVAGSLFGATLFVEAAIVEPDDVAAPLALWLHAGQGVTHSGGLVSQWADQSGNTHDFSQADDDWKPSLSTDTVTGNPTLAFVCNRSQNRGDNLNLPAGSPDYLQLNSTMTAFFVVNAVNLPAGDTQRFFTHFPDGQFRFVDGKANMWSGGNATLNTPSATAGQFQILTYRMDDNIQIGLNDVPVHVRSGVSFSASDLTIGGYRVNHGAFDGAIAEIIIYDTPLTDSQVADVGRYLTNKHGLNTDFSPAVSVEPNLIVAEDFTYNRWVSPSVANRNYRGGEDGPLGSWTGAWSGSGTITGHDDPIPNVARTSSTAGGTSLTRTLDSSGVENGTTLYFSVRLNAEDPEAARARVNLTTNAVPANEIAFGIQDGQVIARVGPYSSNMLLGPVEADQWHLLVGKLEFNVDGGVNERMTLWLDPLWGEPSAIKGAYEADTGVLRIADQIWLNHWVRPGYDHNTVMWDDFRTGTSWLAIAPIPEPGTAALVLSGALGLLLMGGRRKVRTRAAQV